MYRMYSVYNPIFCFEKHKINFQSETPVWSTFPGSPVERGLLRRWTIRGVIIKSQAVPGDTLRASQRIGVAMERIIGNTEDDGAV